MKQNEQLNDVLVVQDNVQKLLEIQRSLIGQFEVIQPGRVSSCMVIYLYFVHLLLLLLFLIYLLFYVGIHLCLVFWCRHKFNEIQVLRFY